jgi:hypothetical protein
MKSMTAGIGGDECQAISQDKMSLIDARIGLKTDLVEFPGKLSSSTGMKSSRGRK